MAPKRSSHTFLHWPLTLAGTLSLGVLLGATLFGHPTGQDKVAQNISRIQEVLAYIRHDYADAVDVDALGQSAIEGMLDRLDPHSAYILPQDLKMANAPLEENFDGIGIEFVLLHDTIQVVTPIAGGPSDKVGILAGDRILRVDGDAVAGVRISNAAVFDKLRGPRQSSVKLEVARPGVAQGLVFNLKRDRIPTKSVEGGVMLDKRTGYIKITRFAGGTDKEFEAMLDQLLRKGANRLVLDLRDNPGGYLEKAISIADHFLPEGATITYTKGQAAKYSQTYKASAKGSFQDGALAVLINEGSASAAEILAGALQDNDRASVIGRRSFGKGLVQMPITLSDGAELRLTISRYYTPSGRCIQKPYDSHDLAQYDDDLDERLRHGELFFEDSIRGQDTVRYQTARGRTVHGGGGIRPDVFVPVDTAANPALLARVEGRYILAGHASAYAALHKAIWQKAGFPAFKARFQMEQATVASIKARAAAEGIRASEAQWAAVLPAMAHAYKAAAARAIFGEAGYYAIATEQDTDIARARAAFAAPLARQP